ncbi:GTP-binding protein EngB required for normal cell division [Brevibacterium sanguinis]|uniref:GTP-binding protein EngB required for normal cell division n=2 Tax=Brevibacterium TaxID=1696 RepID=A0A366IML6_9MICO|nr:MULTISPECIES: GTPase [Brevibacterium]RBP66459.1 GTP-binding protein EngB required for normal cell division [Brevibacterium sanguinis]RBP73111.1 GTP-binding protein EngB required for normal cell division [Brevibacterium celere]
MNDSTQTEIRRLADGIRHSLSLGEDKLGADTRAEASRLLDRAEDRLGLGEDFTVVAFAGSTGSGKSSLFNAVAGLEIARVGVRRPTTARPTACVWGEGGTDVLDWLHVPERSRTWRESALDGDDQRRLHGLILLDLPDHDSTAVEHRVESDRLVGLVDVVFWVVDPQKYADFTLHSEYLTKLAENSSNMVVVLNQIDKLSPEEQTAAVEHLRQLLVADGLTDTEVRTASALTREGIPQIRSILADTLDSKQAAGVRLLSDMQSMARRIQGELGEPVPAPNELPGASRLVETMADAAGVEAVVQTVHDDYMRRAYRKTGYPVLAWAQRNAPDPLGAKHGLTREELIRASVPATSRAQSSHVRLMAHELVTESVSTLPLPWQKAVAEAEKTSTDELAETLDSAVTAVDIQRQTPGWWSLAHALQIMFFVATILGLLGLIAQAVVAVAAPSALPGWSWAVTGGLLVLGVVGSLVTSLVAKTARIRGADAAARDVDSRLRGAVGQVAESSYLQPVIAVVDDHRQAYERLRVH